MQKKRVFISYDYDHDASLKDFLVGQSRHSDSPFELADWSVKEQLSGDWQSKARTQIRRVDLLIVICGEYTDRASGVNAEVRIAREEAIPYFLLNGYPTKNCKRPTSALATDKIYRWTWDNLKALIGGAR